MKSDLAAVAGFFEDLPVLVLVLAGVLSLIFSSVWVSEARSSAQKDSELTFEAREIVSRTSQEIKFSGASDVIPLLGHVKSLNLSDCSLVAQSYDVHLTIQIVYPKKELVCEYSSNDDPGSSSTGFASKFLNAIDDSGLTIILEVQAIVW